MKILIIISLALNLISCGKIESVLDKAESIPDKMDGLNENTKELKRLEAVKTAVLELNDPQNYKIIFPSPFQLLSFAKKAAENMLVKEELVPYIYTKLKIVKDVQFVDVNLISSNQDVKSWTLEDFEQYKLGSYYAAKSIAGFLPEEKIDILLSMVDQSEEYTDVILILLAMRADFIDQTMLNTKYVPSKLTNLGAIEAAVDYNKSLDKILRLPYASEIYIDLGKVFSINKDLNIAINTRLNMQSGLNNWNALKNGIDIFNKNVGQLTVKQSDIRLQKEKLLLIEKTVNQAIQSWTVVSP